MDVSRIEAIVEAHRHRPGATLPILHDLQQAFGHVPPEAIAIIAHTLNLSRAEIFGVASFYKHFHLKPVGKHVVEVCRAESCQAVGGRALEARAVKKLGISWGETTDDGHFTLAPVYCLGACACSPAVRVGDELHGRLTEERFEALLDQLRSEP
jgi:formate dehydrogenase subunit gamma